MDLMSDEVLTGDLLSGGSAPPPPPVSTTTSSSQPSHSTINTTVRMEDVVSLTKQQLFNLREAIVISNDVLQWKQDWYPICLSVVVSICFYIIWWHEMSLLSIFSLGGLLLLTFDFLTMQFHSMVEKYVLPWNDAREGQFHNACVEIIKTKYKISSISETLHYARQKNQAVYYSVMFMLLFSLSWLGSYMNNFFLCYLVTLMVLLSPGLVARGIYEKHVAGIFKKIEDTIRGFAGKKKTN